MAFRVFDGAGDGEPGMVVEEYAGRWLVQSAGPPDADWQAALLAGGQPCWWKHLDPREKADPIPLGDTMPAGGPFLINENALDFEISFRSGYSQGLFLDQRDNRAKVRELCGPGQSFLNLFSYTCAFSVAAAAAGALSSSVDLAGPALEWGKRNFVHNGIDPTAHYFTKGDALEWLAVFAKKGRTFDGIVLDPPTFSRNKGKLWKVEEHFETMVEAAARVLAPGGWMLCSTNCRRLPHWRFDEQIHIGFAEAGRRCEVDWGGMPLDFTGDAYLLNAWCRT
jgi:23S rRNA (cytosine1962-C5)-methyltransferase